MSTSVNKATLAAHLSSEVGMKKSDAEKAITALVNAIQTALTEGQKVTIAGFGTFVVAERPARTGLNPKTREPMQIAASKAVRFRPGKSIKDAVNGSAE